MDFFKCSLVKQEGEDLKLLEFSNFDMKGYFPARLINMMLGSAMITGITKFYGDLVKMQAGI